jgi:hypothetical protein
MARSARLNREQWKDWLEIVGIGAIVGSLVFVGLEVRQNTLAIQDGSHQTSLIMSHDTTEMLWDPEFAVTYDNGIREYSSLDGPARRQFDQYVGQRINVWEYAFAARGRGVMSEELWQAWDRYFVEELRQDALQEVWATRKHGYSQSFQKHVDDILASY